MPTQKDDAEDPLPSEEMRAPGPGPDDRTVDLTTVVPQQEGTVGEGAVNGTIHPAAVPRDSSYRLAPGQQLGPYAIIRPLGRGGMGEVYEAIHSVSHHRLALKILPREHAWSEERRKRFHREGQTAASVNHPHSLYIFGTAEIDGTAIIAMELAPGGTLLDRLDREGVLPVKAAVDAVIQVAEGLQAAAAAGVLHRDVKPANCFVDRSGAVKIGDYGLSLPVEAAEFTQLTQDGSSPMTPAFASPEQMLGQTLDPRADIYSLGATLYNLLTGRTPHAATNLVAMIASVMGTSPPPPSKLRAEIAPGLERVILRCLEKKREDRYPDYASLLAALRSFSSEEQDEAGLRARLAAGFVDFMAAALPGVVLTLLMLPEPRLASLLEAGLWMVATGLMDGFWGGTPGKLLCGLQTVARTGGRAGPWRGLLRALLYGGIPFVVNGFTASADSLSWLDILALLFPLGVLFGPVLLKRAGGPLHDRLTGTRVIRSRRTEPAPTLKHHEPPAALQHAPATWQAGPFRVALDPSAASPGVIAEGHDDTLRRSVWIRFCSPDEPWIPELRRCVRRSTRLRWVDGARGGAVGWDAFEMVPGQVFSSVVPTEGVPWDMAGRWLDDLARELSAAAANGETLPRLALERIWITEANQAVLLDFDPPGDQGTEVAALSARDQEAAPSPEAFLRATAASCLGDSPGSPPGRGERPRTRAPWPLAVTQGFGGLLALPAATLDQLAAELRRLRLAVGSITRRQRAWQFCLVLAPLLAIAMGSSQGGHSDRGRSTPPVADGWEIGHRVAVRDARTMACVRSLAKPHPLPADTSATSYRRAAGIFLRDVLHEPPDSIPKPISWPLWSARQRIVIDSLRREPPPSAAELAWAGGEFARRAKLESGDEPRRGAPMTTLLGLCIMIPLGAFLFAPMAGGGPLLRALGIAVVRNDGRAASKPAILLRSVVTWSPCLVFIIGHAVLHEGRWGPLALIVPIVLFAAGVVHAVVHPQRSIQDRCARTWLVPR